MGRFRNSGNRQGVSCIARRTLSTGLLLVFLIATLNAQYRDLQVIHVTEHGMGRKSVWAITQDADGYMWFGTTNGLHRYDGRDLIIFKSEVRDETSLPNLNTRTFLSDADGEFWICTQGGALSRYQKRSQSFSNTNPAETIRGTDVPDVFDFWSITEGSNHMLWLASMSGDGFFGYDRSKDQFTMFRVPSVSDKHFSQVSYVVESARHQLWVGTMESGIALMDLSGNVLQRFVHRPGDATSISSNNIRVLFEDDRGRLWAGTLGGGLWFYEKQEGRFFPARALQHQQGLFSNIYALYQDEARNLWVGTDNGLVIYNPESDAVLMHFQNDPATAYGLASNRVRSVYRDRGGVYWIGTEGGGVHRIVHKKRFTPIYSASRPGALNADIVRAFLKVDSNRYWIGTQGGGINIYDAAKQRITGTIRHNPSDRFSLSEDRITTFMHDLNRGIWVGTWGGGLNFYDPKTSRFKAYRHDPTDSTTLSDDRIQRTYIDKKGRFWVATENGLNLFDRNTGMFKRLVHDVSKPGTLSGNTIQTFGFVEDSADIFWVGTWQGFNRYDASTNTAERFTYSRSDVNTVSSNHITAIHDSGDGYLWIATFGGGLNRFHKKTRTFELFTEKDGLPHNLVFSILPDRKGHFWLSTSAGLSHFDPLTRQFINFYEEDGLQGNDFWWGAAYASDNGRLFFGGTNGFTTFYPDSIISNSYLPPVVISSVTSQDGRLLPDDNGVIQLEYQRNAFTITFAALDFTDPVKNQFAYRLNGVDDGWVFSGNRNSVRYAGLKGGSYTFMVRGTNNDGLWNPQPAMLTLHVVPPFWDTLWFRVLSGMALALLGAGYFLRRNSVVREQQRILQEEVARRTREIEHQKKTILEKSQELERKNAELLGLNEEKNYLVSVVAHDLRNPLGSVRGYAEYLREEKDLQESERETVLQALEHAAQHGLDLISRILDVEVMEHRKLDLKKEKIELNRFAKKIAASFEAKAAQKHMRIEVLHSGRPVYIEADLQYLTQIAENLISNAVKYAPGGTRIQLLVESVDKWARLLVKDEGPGIDPADQAKLFRKFQRLRAKPTAGETSVGLGLSIVKRFTEAMGGKVWCESKPGNGAAFIVEFPKV
jgi:signal transduction histidine kinase/ligand-binding sensor domain-containing protein